MHCIHCGAQLPDGAKFCTSCGVRVEVVPMEPIQEPGTAEEPVAPEPEFVEEPVQEASEAYSAPENASEGYKAAQAQLPPSYSNPNYSSQAKVNYTVPASGSSNGLAISGFVCSLIFIPIGLGILTAIAGLVLSILGLNNAKKLPGNKGHGLALAGAIISGVRIALILIGIIALFALMIRGVGHVGQEIISNWSDYVPYTD